MLQLAALCFLVLAVPNAISGTPACLDGCECSDVKFTVSCVNGDFDSLPKHIPSYAQDVDFSGNKLSKVGSRIFYKGLRLTKLNLSSNAIDEMAYDAFLNVRHTLTKLGLRGNRLNKIPEDALSQLPLLRELSLANNELEVLNSRGFQKLVGLKKLDISGNWLDRIPTNVFYGLQGLTHLDLSSNSLAVLSPTTLRGLNSLTHLDLSKNSIMKLHPSSLTHVSFIEILNLAENDIENMQVGTYAELGRLKELDVSANKLSQILAGHFEGMKRLEYLNLKGNKIAEISAGAFQDLKMLRTLDISDNLLHVVPVGKSWQGLRNLQTIILAGNEISDISHDIFEMKPGENSEMQSITSLDLSRNNLTVIRPGAFRSVIGLQKLNLAHNQLVTIPGNAFHRNVNLEEIYLGFNALQTPNFSWFQFSSHPHLLDKFKISVSMDGNPWICDCVLYHQASSFLLARATTHKKISPLDDVKCSEPVWIKGRSFTWFLNAEKSHCERSFLRMIQIGVWVLSLLLIIGLFVTKAAVFINTPSIPNIQSKRRRLDSYKRDKIL